MRRSPSRCGVGVEVAQREGIRVALVVRPVLAQFPQEVVAGAHSCPEEPEALRLEVTQTRVVVQEADLVLPLAASGEPVEVETALVALRYRAIILATTVPFLAEGEAVPA